MMFPVISRAVDYFCKSLTTFMPRSFSESIILFLSQTPVYYGHVLLYHSKPEAYEVFCVIQKIIEISIFLIATHGIYKIVMFTNLFVDISN